MLTIHKYQQIADKWDESDEYKKKIVDCCKKDPVDDPNCTDCCYDTWRQELKDVVQIYNKEKEVAEQLQKRLVFITDRRSRYKTWVDELKKAEELSSAICNQLDIIAVQSHKIWYNACNAVEAIQILFCMIKEFYGQVEYLKTRFDDLQTCISKNTDTSLEKGKGILGCLDVYLTKLEALIKTRDEIIKSVVEAVKLANLLRNNIYTEECPPDQDCKNKFDPCNDSTGPCNCNSDDRTPSQYGFKTIICQWYCAFGCDAPCPDPEPCKEQQQKTGQTNYPQPNPDQCIVSCEPAPVFEFPICKDIYRNCVEEWYVEDDKCVKYLAEEVNKKNKNKEALLACKQSLDKAIAEANPKNRC